MSPSTCPDAKGAYKVDPMNIITRSLITATFVLSAPLALACDYPQRVGVPNGTTATKEQMIEGQRGIKDYLASMEEYLACIEAAEQETVAGLNATDEATKQQRIEMFNKKYNAAVEEMNLVAEEFNVQVRAYKQRDQ